MNLFSIKPFRHFKRLQKEPDNIQSAVGRKSLFSGPELLDWLAWLSGAGRRPLAIPISSDESEKEARKQPQRSR